MWTTIGFLLFTSALVVSDCSALTNYSNCNKNLCTLERALYETDHNLFQLNEVFYPPSLLTTRFIKVNYTFMNDEDNSMTCTNVTYIWAVGEILFLQPPTLFKLHSLYFYFPNNELKVLNLTLPYECLPLIEELDHQCSCSNDSMMLDVLTQQLDVYARFTNQDNIQRSNTFARAVCGGELFDKYYSGKRSKITYIIAATILGPALLQILLIVAALLSCWIPEKKSLQSIDPNPKTERLIALIVIGAMASIYIFILDVLAANVVRTSRHEYAEEHDAFLALTPDNSTPLNFWATYVTLGCDAVFILYFLIYFVLIVVDKCKKNRRHLRHFRPQPFYLLLTPIACLTSHLGYIILAWLTEPSRSTATLILYYFIFFYLFLVIQKSYKVMEKIVDKFLGKTTESGACNNAPCNINDSYICTNPHCVQNFRDEDTRMVISLVSQFILVIFYFGIAVVFIMIVYLVPLASEELFYYLYNVIQFMIIVISTQFAYKLLAGKKFGIKHIVMAAVKEMAKDSDYDDYYKKEKNMAKATGKLLAKVLKEQVSPLIQDASQDQRDHVQEPNTQESESQFCDIPLSNFNGEREETTPLSSENN